MVDSLWPANAVAGSPSYGGRVLRQTGAASLAGATSTRPLGARSGVRPGTPSSTVTATSTTWTCQPFAGIADVMTAAEASAYAFAFDAVATGSVTAAHATLPRKDIIYVSFTDPAESVGAVVSATRKYLAGTAAASPVAPSVPGAERGFVVAEINVPASGGGSPSVTWVAPHAVAAGGITPVRTQAERDATDWAPGQPIYRLDIDAIEFRNAADSGWLTQSLAPIAYTPAWTSSGTAPSLGNSTLTGTYVLQGKHVHGVILFTIGTSGVSGGTGTWRFSLPLTPAAVLGVGAGIVLNNGVGRAPIAGEIAASTAYITNLVTASQAVEAMALTANSVIRIAFDFDLP